MLSDYVCVGHVCVIKFSSFGERGWLLVKDIDENILRPMRLVHGLKLTNHKNFVLCCVHVMSHYTNWNMV